MHCRTSKAGQGSGGTGESADSSSGCAVTALPGSFNSNLPAAVINKHTPLPAPAQSPELPCPGPSGGREATTQPHRRAQIHGTSDPSGANIPSKKLSNKNILPQRSDQQTSRKETRGWSPFPALPHRVHAAHPHFQPTETERSRGGSTTALKPHRTALRVTQSRKTATVGAEPPSSRESVEFALRGTKGRGHACARYSQRGGAVGQQPRFGRCGEGRSVAQNPAAGHGGAARLVPLRRALTAHALHRAAPHRRRFRSPAQRRRRR